MNFVAEPRIPSALRARLARVRIFLCDVDGVLTDGSVFMSGTGELKQFDIQDGLGLAILRRSGIPVGWISSRPSAATARRAKDLQIDFLSQSKDAKVPAVERILARAGLTWAEVAYAGDDLVDLAPMKRAGLALAVANAAPEVKRAAHYVTTRPGGHGAIRELAELFLKAQAKWDRVVADYSA